MPKYLIDTNLPYYFNLWKDDQYIHLKDIDDSMLDKKVWEYAKQHNLTIVTKDADFSSRIILSKAPPRVIHLKIGNMTINELFEFLTVRWNNIIDMSEKYKLVNVYKDTIEGIS